jgi:hypothetical protein
VTDQPRTRVRASGVWYLSDMPLDEWRSILASGDTYDSVYEAVREKSGARSLVTRKYVAAVEEGPEGRALVDRVDDALKVLGRAMDVLDPERGVKQAEARRLGREAIASAVATLRVGP